MNRDDFTRALDQKPFRPFTLFVSDGGHYDVDQPDWCEVGERTVSIRSPSQDRYYLVDLNHVTRLEVGPPPVTATDKEDVPSSGGEHLLPEVSFTDLPGV